MKRGHLGPVLTHPGLFRGVHDGRYKFARYFTPAQHHIPRDWDTLLRYNQLELYDTQVDPDEIINLAADPQTHKDLILALNDKVNTLIMEEIGFDDGREHPGRTFYRSAEHTSELQSLMRISYAVFCLKKKNTKSRERRQVKQNSKNNIQ